jgi:hypothetical protein
MLMVDRRFDPEDACCHTCYTGLWRDAIRVATELIQTHLGELQAATDGLPSERSLELFSSGEPGWNGCHKCGFFTVV